MTKNVVFTENEYEDMKLCLSNAMYYADKVEEGFFKNEIRSSLIELQKYLLGLEDEDKD